MQSAPMAFPDPSQPIATCVANDCAGCPVQGKIHCHFRFQDLLYFLVISLPGLVIGGAGVLAAGAWHLVLWIAIMTGFFGFVEIRVMCAHCPHYAEEGKTLGCWANYGAPKLWQYRPGPMSAIENRFRRPFYRDTPCSGRLPAGCSRRSSVPAAPRGRCLRFHEPWRGIRLLPRPARAR